MSLRLYVVFLLLVSLLMATVTLADEQVFARSTLSWSPNEQWIAIADDKGLISISNLEVEEKSIQLKHSSLVTAISWSPDGSRFATATPADGLISIWDLTTGSLIKTLQADISPDGRTDIAWNPKQEILVSIGFQGDGGMLIRFWETRTYTQIGTASWIVPLSLKWSPDGILLAVTGYDEGLFLYDTFRGEDIPAKAFIPGIWHMDWSPDSKRIAALKYVLNPTSNGAVTTFGTSSWLTILDAETLEEMAQLTEPLHNSTYPILWSPDGSRIAVLKFDQIEVIDANSGASLEQFSIIPDTTNFNFVWSPFGGRLAIAGTVDQSISEAIGSIEDIQIFVPAPSPELLTSIEAACVPAKAQSILPAAETLTTDVAQLAAYTDAVRADTNITPACAADLIAVAEALKVDQP